ncbi:serine/arginine-rich splicing factor SR30 isoform X3 [Fagus crenata]
MRRCIKRTVYVGNLPGYARLKDVAEVFCEYGHIVDIDLKEASTPRTFAFVEYENPFDAKDAVYFADGCKFNSHRLRVIYAHGPRGDSPTRDRYKNLNSQRGILTNHCDSRRRCPRNCKGDSRRRRSRSRSRDSRRNVAPNHPNHLDSRPSCSRSHNRDSRRSVAPNHPNHHGDHSRPSCSRSCNRDSRRRSRTCSRDARRNYSRSPIRSPDMSRSPSRNQSESGRSLSISPSVSRSRSRSTTRSPVTSSPPGGENRNPRRSNSDISWSTSSSLYDFSPLVKSERKACLLTPRTLGIAIEP